MIVPGYGYLSDEHEVLEYCDMVVIVRGRIRALINEGATLAVVKAAPGQRPIMTPVTAPIPAPGRTDMFVEAVYHSMKP